MNIDLRQEATLYALRKIHLYNEEGKLMQWLRTITRNLFINRYRKEQKVRTYQINSWQMTNERNSGEYRCEVEEIMKHVEGMAAKHRQCLEMIIDGYSYDEIAEKQNVVIGTVKSQIHHPGNDWLKNWASKPEKSNGKITIVIRNHIFFACTCIRLLGMDTKKRD